MADFVITYYLLLHVYNLTLMSSPGVRVHRNQRQCHGYNIYSYILPRDAMRGIAMASRPSVCNAEALFGLVLKYYAGVLALGRS